MAMVRLTTTGEGRPNVRFSKQLLQESLSQLETGMSIFYLSLVFSVVKGCRLTV
jgi:hypothetical protein